MLRRGAGSTGERKESARFAFSARKAGHQKSCSVLSWGAKIGEEPEIGASLFWRGQTQTRRNQVAYSNTFKKEGRREKISEEDQGCPPKGNCQKRSQDHVRPMGHQPRRTDNKGLRSDKHTKAKTKRSATRMEMPKGEEARWRQRIIFRV